ncbi:metal-dependent hydrolase [Facklamia lactis]|uniref:metal-dependent hydrolase n=1 Tax=Facklamia lactis TaxID=2749967 RepID=UPI0018CC9F00|nr:metal-dependent hydrolase [Facklamia lactis]MBG9981201.1 metal-dependent hydrolase [Facklamia lactis]
MQITHYGHAVVHIVTETGTRLIIDPFINGNPFCQIKPEQLAVDVILLTHAHSDHFGDTLELAKQHDALVITVLELADYLENQGVRVHGMQPGGSHPFDFGKVTLTQAIHGSSLWIDDKPFTFGLATGIILEIENKTLYHLGDTALFSDLSLYGKLYDIDLAFIPIGDNYTMGPEHAKLAAQWLQAKKVIPIHYNTFPLIEQDPQAFVNSLDENQGFIPSIGESFDLNNH